MKIQILCLEQTGDVVTTQIVDKIVIIYKWFVLPPMTEQEDTFKTEMHGATFQ